MLGAIDPEHIGHVGVTDHLTLGLGHVGAVDRVAHHTADDLIDGGLMLSLASLLEQAQLLLQRLGCSHEIGRSQDVVHRAVQAVDGERLGALGGLSNERRVEPPHFVEDGVVINARIELVLRHHCLDQTFDSLAIQAADVDDRVQAAGAEHALVDALQVVGGHHDHQLTSLGGDAIECIQ